MGSPPGQDPDRTRGFGPEEIPSAGAIGPYRLLSILGEGGFGVVYLAEQTKPVRRRVALKVIKPGMDSRAVIARFEAERQALAIMDHPGIAKVFDAGTTPEGSTGGAGRPYFVMELISGEPITNYCDRHNLSIRDRLELFEHVCEAVQHAHQRGIIHRDLKPSNILVCIKQDDQARPVVIDFGVAKALNQLLTESTLVTMQGQPIGTPEYMSPEQAEMSPVDVDTRSDVYSLGVVLYELLVGTPPFDSWTLRSAGLAAAQRMIREVEPPRPSTRIGRHTGSRGVRQPTPDPAKPGGAGGTQRAVTDDPRDGPTRGSVVARHRATDEESLKRTLKRELEWIPLKALRKDRTERYRTAAELGDDIRNYLDGRPLIAGPETALYRVRVFARRHRVPVIVGSAFALLLVLGVIAMTALTSWALRERDSAIAARDEAGAQSKEADRRRIEAEEANEREREARALAETNERKAREAAETTEAVSTVLDEMLTSVDPDKSAGREPTVRSVLDAASARMSTALEQQPAARARVLLTIGHAYRTLGLDDAARRHLNAALAIQRERPEGANDPMTADILFQLSRMGGSKSGDYQAEALEIRRRVGGEGDAARMKGQIDQVGSKVARGDVVAAEKQFANVLSYFYGGKKTPLQVHEEIEALLLRTEELVEADDRAAAIALVDDYVQPFLRVPQMRNEVAEGVALFAFYALRTGRPVAALVCGDASLDIARRNFGGQSSQFMRAEGTLAQLLAEMGDLDAAERHGRHALDLAEKLFKGEGEHLRDARLMLAALLSGRGKDDEARELRVSADALRAPPDVSDLKGNDPDRVIRLAAAQARAGDVEGAITAYRRAIELLREPGADRYHRLPSITGGLALLLASHGDLKEAETLGRQTLAMYESIPSGHEVEHRQAVALLASILDRTGREEEATKVHRAMVRLLLSRGPSHAEAALVSMNTLASRLVDRGDAQGGLEVAREALEMARAFDPPIPSAVADELAVCSRALLAASLAAEAEPLLRECVEIRARILEQRDWRIANARSMLGGALTLLGRLDEAEPLLVESFTTMEASGQAPAVRLQEAAARAAQYFERAGKADDAATWKARAAALAPASTDSR